MTNALASWLFAAVMLLVGCGGGDVGDDGALVGILITPENVIVPEGQEVQLFAKGLYENRTTRDITSAVSWTSSNSGVVEVKNDLDTEGVLIGASEGEATIEASFEGILSAPVRVTVTSAELIGISVEPAKVTVEVGQEIQLEAIAAYTDGSRGDASTQVRWITADGSVAQISSSGVLKGVASGSTTVQAKWEDLTSEEVSVTVAQSAIPDLYISDLVIEAGTEEATVNLKMGNRGTGGASDFWIDIFIDPSSEPSVGDYGDLYTAGGYVGPGEEIDVSFNIGLDEGSHEIWVVLDTENLLEESDESNNVAGGTVTVGGNTWVGPNLTVTYFDYVADGNYIYYYVDITNEGGEAVGEFYVDLFYDLDKAPEFYTDGDMWVHIESLGAGETTYADFLVETWKVELECKYCWSWVLIDSLDMVEETSEDDNVGGHLPVSP